MNKKILIPAGLAVVMVCAAIFAVIVAMNVQPVVSDLPSSRDKPINQVISETTDDTPNSSLTSQKSDQKKKTGNKEGIIPHRALYEIKLIAAHGGSQIANISGEMFFEWKADCEAWTTDHRFNLIYEYTDSPAMQITSDFSTWETLDGTTFNFSSRRSRDGQIYEELRGRASIDEDGTNGKATFNKPETLEFDLPDGTLFPMRHTLLLSEEMDANKSPFFNRTVFDGSDVDGPVEINAFIGKKANAMAAVEATPRIDPALLNTPAKMIQMAFFPLINKDSPDADYEMEAVFHKNGIISDMRIFYNEFSIQQKLVALEELDYAEDCKK